MSDCAVCANPQSETASYYRGSHTPQCASYYTGSHTLQHQTVRYVLLREVRQRLTTRDLIPHSVRLCALCDTPRGLEISQSMRARITHS